MTSDLDNLLFFLKMILVIIDYPLPLLKVRNNVFASER